MPRLSAGHRQINLSFPADLLDRAKEGAAKADTTLTAEFRKTLERLARIKPKSREKNKSENT